MTGKSGIVQTFPNAVPGPEPSPDAIERLYRVGRQHQLGRSHASVTSSDVALSRPLRIQERTDAMPGRCHTGNVSAGERRQQTGHASRRRRQHAVNSRRFAHPVPPSPRSSAMSSEKSAPEKCSGENLDQPTRPRHRSRRPRESRSAGMIFMQLMHR